MFSNYDSKLFDVLSNSTEDTFFFASNIKKNTSRWSKGAVSFFNLPGEILYPANSLWIKNIHPEDLHIFMDDMNNMLRNKSHYHNCEYRIMTNEGKYVWINCRGYMTYDEIGEPDYFAGFVTKMGYKNKIDPITNLRTLFEFRNDLSQILSEHKEGLIFMLKLKHFKQIIDEYGYKFGDYALYSLGASLRSFFNKDIKIYRMDSVNFAFIILKKNDFNLDSMENSLTQIFKSIDVNGIKIHLDFTIVATLFPQDGDQVDNLQQNLHYALEDAKATKTNSITFYKNELYKKKQFTIQLKDALKQSIEHQHENFEIFFQPIIDAKTNCCVSAEALLRWSHKKFGSVSPIQFIPILEESKAIISTGNWIIDQSLKHLANWNNLHSAGNILKHIHVNISYIQFKEPNFKDFIIKKLDEYKLPRQSLVLELTESCRIEHTSELSDLFMSFRKEGLSIALDDFGTGYASLILLCDIPADILKLDYSMTKSFVEHPQHRTLLKLITNFCRQNKMKLCAEGIETKESLDIMKKAGADQIQGFYYSKPIPIPEFYEKFVKQNKV